MIMAPEDCVSLQDLVVPVLKHPADIGSSALLDNPQRNITTLLLFRGDVGAERQPHYSRGIRQTLHTLVRPPACRLKRPDMQLTGQLQHCLPSSTSCGGLCHVKGGDMLLRPSLPAQAQEQDWRGRHGILIGSRDEIEGDYSQLLSSSLFCLVVPGAPPAALTLWANGPYLHITSLWKPNNA